MGKRGVPKVFRNNANVGTATAVITGRSNYTGTVTKTFNITKKLLTDTDVNISDLADHIYNGQPYQPRPEVKIGQRVLRENVDYTLSYAGDPANKGTVTVTVTGMGNYNGTVQRSYQITAKALQAQWLTVSPATMTYTGSELKPLALVAHGEVRLIEGTDYDVTYANNTATGTATVKVTGKGNYTGEISGTFRIVSNVGGLSVTLSSSEADYTGEDQKPTLTVRAGGAPTEEYTATYTYNGGESQPFHGDTELVDVGVYTITVNGQGNYAGATVLTVFTIRPATFTVEAVGEQDYTGGPVTPKPIVIGNGEVLTEHVDYMLTYANNVALGENTASITVTGLGNYAGATQTVRFTITGAHTLFHVTYDGNGHSAGEPPVDNRDYLSGNAATVLDGARLGRLGAVFLGWSADRQPLVTTRAAEAAVTLLRAGQEFAVNANVTLYAVWGADSDHNGRPDYAEQMFITASAGEGGSIAPDGKRTATWGEAKVEYTITVDSGYTFSGVSVDGKTVAVSTADAPTPLTKGENGVYTYVFTDVKEDHVILATFRKNGGSGSGGGGGGTTLVVEPSQEEEPDTGVEKWLLLEPHDGYLKGRGNGLFGPNDSMTRAEAAMMFYRLLKEKDVPITVSFRDVPEDAWYSRAVGVMASIGLLKGVGGDCFDPNRPITRAEFAVLISRMATWEEVGQVRAYTDISSEDWFYGNVQLISYYGWMAGYPDGSFGPQRNISRGEAAKVINAMTRRRADKEAIDKEQGVRFDDVPESHWAFYEVMEAAISHGHQNVAGKEIWELK